MKHLKGITPNLNIEPKKETSNKYKYKFIELGVKSICKEDCDCDECSSQDE